MTQTQSAGPSLQKQLPHKEVRFAVVMYGGVSLAIYIHGVAQELLSIVRATARKKDGSYLIEDESKLNGAELVYRCLGESLNAKFIVDILSGTSAGGINAVYLAKALVNNKSMDGLKELWVREGDIAKLINDEESIMGLGGLALSDPPEALLNSQRMYYKLLYALNTMGSSDELSPLVKELDLNITATDIRGLNLPIKIRNRSVNELRYKTVFRFKYRTERTFTEEQATENDFKKEKDPFLAFAARCTSSIPPAFEAMQLKDIADVLKTGEFKNEYNTVLDIETDEWRNFYADYVRTGDTFSTRFFGDGGYLDNKPFSYATEDLLTRRADLPVDRKLLYIEPSPEHPEDLSPGQGRPNMFQNVLAALVGLPRQETIREDLASILARNEDINRANKIFAQVNDVFNKTMLAVQAKEHDAPGLLQRWISSGQEWAGKYLDQLINDYGLHYPAYHQLRMEDVLDTLTLQIARGLGWGKNTEEAQNLRFLLEAWRDKYYAANAVDVEKKEERLRNENPALTPKIHSENEILYRLDINWRRRRMYFIQKMADMLLDSLAPIETQAQKDSREQARTLQRLSGKEWPDEAYGTLRREYRLALEDLKEKLNLIDVGFNRRINKIQYYGFMQDSSAELAKQFKELYELLTSKTVDQSGAETLLHGFAAQLRNKQRPGDVRYNDVLDRIEKLNVLLSSHAEDEVEDSSPYYIKDALRFMAIRSLNTLGTATKTKDGRALKGYQMPKNADIPIEIYETAQDCLRYFYNVFEFYDMLTYPLQFGNDMGESDEVEIIRVSPEDARMLVDERKTGRLKLAGTKLSNFGAFFKQEWRENDMLWGRLDAVELLLKELLEENDQQESPKRKRLCSILWERLSPEEKARYDNLPEKLNPYEFAFERILEQDLRPRDIAIFYSFINGESLPSAAARKMSTVPEPKLSSPALIDLLQQKKRIEGLESDLTRLQADKSLERLEASFYQTLHVRPNLGVDQLKQNLAKELEELSKQKSELSQKINEEQQRLASEAKKEASKQQSILKDLDDASAVLQSMPDTIRKKSQEVLSQYQKNDLIRYRDLLRAVAKDGKMLHYFRYGYDVNKEFESEATVVVAERSARTISRMLQGLAEQYPLQKPVGFLTLMLQIATAIINLALPKKIGTFLFFGYWIWLLYVAEGMIWFAGTITGSEAIARVGSFAFVITVALHFLVFQVNRLIVRTSRRKNVVWFFYGAALVIWMLGLWLQQATLANMGWITLAMIAGIHAASSVGRQWPKLRWLRPTLVSLLTLILLAIFALGLAYLGVFVPKGWVADLIGSLQQVISK